MTVWVLAGVTSLASVSACGDGTLESVVPEPARPTSITVEPSSATLTWLGEKIVFLAQVKDQYGAAFPGTVAWSSSNEAVFMIDAGGTATAVANGSGTVSATFRGLSAVADVDVTQQPWTMDGVSGDDQEARVGAVLPEPVVVQVADAGGSPVEGATVVFTPGQGHGTADPAEAVSDRAGLARTAWMLGEAVGEQRLVVTVRSVPGLDPVVFHAAAVGIPAEIAVVAGADQEAPVATPVPVVPEVLVTDANGVPLADIPVVFTTELDATVANPEVHTNAQGRANPGTWTLGSSTGIYQLFASVDGDGIEGNPVRFEAVALPGPAARLVVVEGDGQESETKLPVPVTPRIQVTDDHGNGVADVAVTFSAGGDSEVTPTETRTDLRGFTSVDKWILGTTAGATYRLTATVKDNPSATATFTATAIEAVYNIEIVHVSSSLLTDSQREAFERAEEFWETAIKGNLDWSTVRKPSLEDCLAKNGITGEIPADRVVDDLLIYAQVREIDGHAGEFGGAGPCQIRADNSLPVVGVMFFDRSDLDGLETNGHLDGTILHEMAHAIGFGTLWDHLNLLRNPASGLGAQDTQFTGDSAVAAWGRIRGDHYPGSEFVPVQHQGGEGVWNRHWRELVFRSELMTPFPDRGPNPLSVISLASLVDIGYEEVDYSVADEYVLPPPVGAKGGIEGSVIPGGDILRTPIAVVDRDGNVVRVIPPPQS